MTANGLAFRLSQHLIAVHGIVMSRKSREINGYRQILTFPQVDPTDRLRNSMETARRFHPSPSLPARRSPYHSAVPAAGKPSATEQEIEKWI